MVGIGVLIGDYNGNIFGALGQKIALPQSIEHVEAHVASRAMVFARELSLFKLIFEGDCLRVIKAINTKEPCKSLFGHIIEEIWSFSSALMLCCTDTDMRIWQFLKNKDTTRQGHEIGRAHV